MSFGARTTSQLRFGPPGGIPPVVRYLLIANIALFVLPSLAGYQRFLVQNFGMIPADVFLGGRIWQLGTYMFLHGGAVHLFYNMFMLWMFGGRIEHEWGQRPFLTYYLVCGVGAAVTQWIAGPTSPVPVIGASGALYGILVAYGLMYPDEIVYFNLFIPIKVKYLVGILILSNVLFIDSADGVARIAHLGGALTGFLFLKQDWRLGAMGRKVRGARARWQMQQNARQQQRRDVEKQTVDEILDKINTQGFESLSERERRILDEASRRK